MEGGETAVNSLILRKLRKRRLTIRPNNSESSSDDDEVLAKMARKIECKHHDKIKNFVQDIVLQYSLSDFQKHFRISKTKFEELLSVIKLENDEYCRRTPYPLIDGLLLTIWSLATQESFREIGTRYNVSEGHAYRIFIKYCCIITKLKEKYILWPKGLQAQQEVQEFNRLRGEGSFPNVFGCLDGTHIAIPGPTDDNSYYNRKGFHSLQLQAICDSKAKFINVFCGWPGSVHDARVWRSCRIYQMLEENPLALLPAGTYLLGDCAYPLSKYLITPFKDNGHLSRKHRIFNAKLSSTRVIIEQAFGRLKGMFRRLKYLNITKLSNAKYILIAACVLHNLCVKYDEVYELPKNNEEDDINDDEIQEGSKEAIEFRNQIMNNIIR